MAFLPINKQDMKARGIDKLDFIYISGDAYVDHPSFGVAVITRIIESMGFTVGVVAEPQTDDDYKRLGEPNFAFLAGSGVVDSMVNNYTVNKRKRSDDSYSEGGVGGKRPDRALTVYSKNLKRLFPDSYVIIGGIEASLRRFSHYDYWNNEVMPSILQSSEADLLIYGMGEKPLWELGAMLKKGIPIEKIKDISGTAYLASYDSLSNKIKKELNEHKNYLLLPSFEEVKSNKKSYVKAFNLQEQNTHYVNAFGLIQKHKNKYLVQNRPAKTLTSKEMDSIYDLPFERTCHPVYKKGVPALREVEFSITAHRGCFGGCSFCSLNYHQGRAIQYRSKESIVKEAKLLTGLPNFKGYIHDVGGPSANFHRPSCKLQEKIGICKNKQCIGHTACKNLVVSHNEYLEVLREVREIEGIKKVFVRSGIRFDYLMKEQNPAFFDELCKHHISGQLKIAPEHISDNVLKVMNKPESKIYLNFTKRYTDANMHLGKKQYIVPYFISSHPGSTLEDAIDLCLYLKSINYMPLQVQDFYPTPSTRSTCMYYTGLNPSTLEPVYVAKTKQDKLTQRAFLQYRKKENYPLILEGLRKAGREDLIGFTENCIIKPTKDMATGRTMAKTVDRSRGRAPKRRKRK